ncbi:DUF2956 family protein, partial [Photobacterium leiognathi]
NKASNDANNASEVITDTTVIYQQSKLAWGLLIASWLGFITYLLLPRL